MKHVTLAGIFGAVVLATLVASAQEPMRNISKERHPNLGAAQDLARRAYERLSNAQSANEFRH